MQARNCEQRSLARERVTGGSDASVEETISFAAVVGAIAGEEVVSVDAVPSVWYRTRFLRIDAVASLLVVVMVVCLCSLFVQFVSPNCMAGAKSSRTY